MPKERAEWTAKDDKRGFRVLGVKLTKEEFDYMREISEVNQSSMSTVARGIFLQSRKDTLDYSLKNISSTVDKLNVEILKTKEHLRTLEKLVGKETV